MEWRRLRRIETEAECKKQREPAGDYGILFNKDKLCNDPITDRDRNRVL